MVLITVASLAHGREFDDRLLGNWGGMRSVLIEHGLDLDLSYNGEFAANVRGGGSEEQAYADQFYLGGSLDLERLVGLPSTKIVFSFTDRNGQSLSLTAPLGTLLEVQQIYGQGTYTRLDQLYLEQHLFGNMLELKFGRLTGSFDFMAFSCYFQNLTFCSTLPSHNVAENWVAFPGSTWAGIARVNFKNDWYLQAGVYEVNPAYRQPKYRFAFGSPFSGPGTREVVEVGWLPPQAGAGGGYRVGVWYDDVGGNDLYLNADGAPLATNGGKALRRHQQRGFYAMAQQRVWSKGGSDSRGISLFMNWVQADRRISRIEQIAELGLLWTGVTSWRPQDDLGAAIGRVRLNDLIARGEEYPIEIYYGVNITPAIVVRPNIQYILAPGGVDERSDVLVFGLHLSMRF